ncbi:MAG: retroviral-like aspartic protease family protein [Pyrinomonadaceae bacterium]|nr:retroviral-like aspartic protease family protein [Pyrinomonadaceae bacterium]
MTMKIRYTKLPDLLKPNAYSWYPLLQVCARYENKGRVFTALVDSGAIDCIFPESIGRLLGIDVRSGKPRTYFGLAQQAAPGFLHSIKLQVTGLDHWISLDVGFISADVMPLLGQGGFFSTYQIIFERFRYQFEVNKRKVR